MEKLLKIKLYEKQLDSIFKKYLDLLEVAKLYKITDLKSGELPKTGGIYVFYEGTKNPIYVGRTKNIRQRIQLHTRDSSKNESATFTFNLAKKEYYLSLPKEEKITRKDLMNKIDFIPLFAEQKERVKKMHVKYIEEEHDILQTILEPYIAFKLNTYPNLNSFETH